MQLIDLIKCIPYTQPISVVDAKSEATVFVDARGRLKIWEMARYLNRDVLDISAYRPLDIPAARIRIVVKSEEE